ncbi:DNA double-strand break repair nuclease NurA [Desulfurobacterium sp.]
MSIKGHLLKAAAEKKSTIYTNIEELPSQTLKKVKELWNPFKGRKIDVSIGAVDGSLNKKEYLGFVVFAAAAVSVFFNSNGEEENRESYNVDIDILKPLEYSESRVRLFMGILEIKELIKLNREKNPDILLVDGSIIGDIIRPVSFAFQIEEKERYYVETELFPKVKETFSLNSINAKNFYNEIIRNTPPDRFPVIAGYLEYLEYLLSIEKLLDEAGEKVVAISKRSSSKIYDFDSIMPDIFIFQLANTEPGYSTPVRITISPEKKYKFPEIFEESFRKRSMNIFFVKFSSHIYKIETMMKPENIISALEKTIINSYPFPLKLAHDSVKIDNHTMDKIVSILSIHFRTGREGVD